MDHTLFGKLSRPAVVLVGSWDPLNPEYYSIIGSANRYCTESNFELVLVLLDPLPSNFLNNKVSPIYDCHEVRIKYLRNICTAVCKIRMDEKVTDGGVQKFLPTLNSYFQIAELWLREGQTLGTGPKNSIRDIIELCNDLNISFKSIKHNKDLTETSNKVKFYLQSGQVELASVIVGHPPLWRRPQTGNVAVGWKVGKYKYRSAVLNSKWDIQYGDDSGFIEIFHNEQDHAVFLWPDNNIELIAILEKVPDVEQA